MPVVKVPWNGGERLAERPCVVVDEVDGLPPLLTSAAAALVLSEEAVPDRALHGHLGAGAGTFGDGVEQRARRSASPTTTTWSSGSRALNWSRSSTTPWR